MNLAQIGNASAPFSTENEINKALTHLGHKVAFFDESHPKAFRFNPAEYQAVIWTHTQGFNKQNPHNEQREMLRKARKTNVPTVQYHLDRWWGLSREHLVHEEPAFDTDIVCTADGGHQEEWESIGVDHRWFPPAVSEFECDIGTPRDEYRSDIAFIGSWQGGYHSEAKHRFELVKFLQDNYGGRVKFYPEPGKESVRQKDLQDLIASVKVVVGDSCIVDWNTECCYWSDRIPETLGRGGFLIHPYVKGMEDHFGIDLPQEPPPAPQLLEDSVDLWCWRAGEWEGLEENIEYALSDVGESARHLVAEAGQQHVLKHHTYTRRMEQLFELMQQEGML